MGIYCYECQEREIDERLKHWQRTLDITRINHSADLYVTDFAHKQIDLWTKKKQELTERK